MAGLPARGGHRRQRAGRAGIHDAYRAVRFEGRGSAVRITTDDLDAFVNASRITPDLNASTGTSAGVDT